MYVNLEHNERYAIQAYDEHEIQINNQNYSQSLIVTRNEIIPSWPVHNINQLNEQNVQPLLKYKPNIILIGCLSNLSELLKFHQLKKTLEAQLISIELTSIGAASRTFNILIKEHRDVALGIIFPESLKSLNDEKSR